MAISEKEVKPLLEKSSTNQQQQSNQQQNNQKNNSMKNKGKTSSKPKLFSVSETSTEADSTSKEERRGQCFEKDVDESETQKMKQKNPGQTTLSPHPPHHQQASAGESQEDVGKATIQPFGVKSYLHHFYESVSQTQTPQDENYQYLIHPKGSNCGAIWFKIGLIIGATLFLLGAVAIVIGYAIPKQRVIMGISENIEIIDNDARRFNENLDRCKLIGLAGFCSGGLILVISLLAPTFTSTYWEDDPATEPFRVSLSSHILGTVVPASLDSASEPNQSPIPVTEKIKCIQPVWTD